LNVEPVLSREQASDVSVVGGLGSMGLGGYLADGSRGKC
jgi:hypothetical protein